MFLQKSQRPCQQRPETKHCQHDAEQHWRVSAGAKLIRTSSSDSARIKNALTGIPKADLLRDVEDYAQKHQLTDALPYLRKGALVAQRPDDFECLEELDEEDREALRVEKTHKWKHPKMLYYTILLNSFSAIIQGWDQTGSNGANLSFPQAFGIEERGDRCTAAGTCERNSWIIGAINSAPYMAIALL